MFSGDEKKKKRKAGSVKVRSATCLDLDGFCLTQILLLPPENRPVKKLCKKALYYSFVKICSILMYIMFYEYFSFIDVR